MSQDINKNKKFLSSEELLKLTDDVVAPLIFYLNNKGISPNKEFIENVIHFHANKNIFNPNLTVSGTKQIMDFVAEYFGVDEPVFTDVTKAVMARIMRQNIPEHQYSSLFDDFDSNHYDRIK